jgi:hypothetical protein
MVAPSAERSIASTLAFLVVGSCKSFDGLAVAAIREGRCSCCDTECFTLGDAVNASLDEVFDFALAINGS